MTKKPIWEFVIYTGSMFSGKSSHLISAVERHRIRGSKVVCFKPKIDDRYAMNSIVTHAGGKIGAIAVSNGEEIERLVERQDAEIVAVDEAFMIEGSAEVLIKLFRKGLTVYVSSIELSSNLKPFEEIEKMMPYATKIKKCAAVCVSCGDDAHVTHRKVNSSSEISVGGADTYEPLCWHCHPLTGIEDVNNRT